MKMSADCRHLRIWKLTNLYMTRTDSPVARAYLRLMEIARGDYAVGDARLFALSWLAAARMVTQGAVSGKSALGELADATGWQRLHEAGFPAEAIDFAGSLAAPNAVEMSKRWDAIRTVAELQLELGSRPWDVLPCLFDAGGRKGGDYEFFVLPELLELLLDLVGRPEDGELWIPFDAMGQFTISAFRRGWSLLTASPLAMPTLIPRLLLTIETGRPEHPRVRGDVERDSQGRPVSRADYVLAMPPIGVQVRQTRLAYWDASGSFDQFARSESWAIHEFVNRAAKRAVFVTPQGVLFGRGQEERVREYLIHRGGDQNQLEAVISLPPGVFSATAIAGAVISVNTEGNTDSVRMVDLGSGRRALSEAAGIIAAGHKMALGLASGNGKMKLVSPAEIVQNEYSFAPSRYLRRLADFGENATKLGALCVALRPPVTVKEATHDVAAEVGVADLNAWRPVQREIEKVVFLKTQPRESALVRPGDIVISIKGAVGKVALMGAAAERRATVVSQSCLVLRLNEQLSKTLCPEFLLMYLRSPQGQAQLEGLQVGAGVAHISPSTLLSSVFIPMPNSEEHRAVLDVYERLCMLEQEVESRTAEMAGLTQGRWPVSSQDH